MVYIRFASVFAAASMVMMAAAADEQPTATKIKNPIVTDIVPFENWWDAEEYHQKYLVNNPGSFRGRSSFKTM